MRILKSFETGLHKYNLLEKFKSIGMNVNVFNVIEKTGNKESYFNAVREDGVMLWGVPANRIADEKHINKKLSNSKIKAYEEFNMEDVYVLMGNHEVNE